MLLLIIVAGRLLDRLMRRLAHSIYEWDPVASGLGHKARPQSMGAEIGWIKSGQAASLLQDQVDRLRGQRGRANRAVLPDFPEDWSRCDLSELHPLMKRQQPPGQRRRQRPPALP